MRYEHLGRKELANPVAEAIRKAQLAETEPETCEECGRKLDETEIEEFGDLCSDCFDTYITATHPENPDRRGR